MSDTIEEWENEIAQQEEHNLEVTNEVSIYRGDGISIHIDVDDAYKDSFAEDPYFKVYDNESQTKSRNDIRVSLKDGSLVYHRDGKGDLKMTHKLAKKLDDIMDKRSNIGNHKGQTVYDALYASVKDVVKDKEVIQHPKVTLADMY